MGLKSDEAAGDYSQGKSAAVASLGMPWWLVMRTSGCSLESCITPSDTAKLVLREEAYRSVPGLVF